MPKFTQVKGQYQLVVTKIKNHGLPDEREIKFRIVSDVEPDKLTVETLTSCNYTEMVAFMLKDARTGLLISPYVTISEQS